jgi:HSP20 family protein
MNTTMNTNDTQDLTVREKEEVTTTEEGTREGLYFRPDVDIFETEAALTLLADVPGASAENIEIDLRDNLLTITAVVEERESRFRPVFQEFQTGHFTRQFRLGQEIDQAEITAEVNDGVLRLTLPKAARAVPRKIQVT